MQKAKSSACAIRGESMTCNPTHEKIKAIVGVSAAIVGTSLIVFTGMGIHYRSEVAKVEQRYEAVFVQMDAKLQVEREVNREDLQLILGRIDRIERKLQVMAHEKEE